MVKIGHASIDERGKISGGKAGNQTGKELCIRSWYNKPWNVVVRMKIPAMRLKVADCIVKAIKNPYIGYDQNQRNTLLNLARIVGYNPALVKELCETDCSALVTLACIYAGIRESSLVVSGNSATTSTLRKRLQATGAVDVFVSKEYTQKPDKLLVGDILISEGHHTAVVVESDNKDVIIPKESISKIAHDVIDGKYGMGAERKKRLAEAGYDYKEVQDEVNRLLK